MAILFVNKWYLASQEFMKVNPVIPAIIAFCLPMIF